MYIYKYIYKYIYIYNVIHIYYIYKSKVKLATVVEGNQKAPFSIATTSRCWRGRHPFLWSALLYP